jgi:ABC-type polysaccharide transport system, permease component
MKRNLSVLNQKKASVSYAKWGIIFIIPFLVTYLIFNFIPQLLTIIYSFFEYYNEGLEIIGPNFVGLDNYEYLFTPAADGTIRIFKYCGNTLLLWIIGAVPQFVVALLLAMIFTSARLNLKGQRFFKTLFYLPNVIMASAFALLVFNFLETADQSMIY